MLYRYSGRRRRAECELLDQALEGSGQVAAKFQLQNQARLGDRDAQVVAERHAVDGVCPDRVVKGQASRAAVVDHAAGRAVIGHLARGPKSPCLQTPEKPVPGPLRRFLAVLQEGQRLEVHFRTPLRHQPGPPQLTLQESEVAGRIAADPGTSPVHTSRAAPGRRSLACRSRGWTSGTRRRKAPSRWGRHPGWRAPTDEYPQPSGVRPKTSSRKHGTEFRVSRPSGTQVLNRAARQCQDFAKSSLHAQINGAGGLPVRGPARKGR